MLPVALLVVEVPLMSGLPLVLSADRIDPGRRGGTPGVVLECPVPVSDNVSKAAGTGYTGMTVGEGAVDKLLGMAEGTIVPLYRGMPYLLLSLYVFFVKLLLGR